jgi:hypothetical protein
MKARRWPEKIVDPKKIIDIIRQSARRIGD